MKLTSIKGFIAKKLYSLSIVDICLSVYNTEYEYMSDSKG